MSLRVRRTSWRFPGSSDAGPPGRVSVDGTSGGPSRTAGDIAAGAAGAAGTSRPEGGRKQVSVAGGRPRRNAGGTRLCGELHGERLIVHAGPGAGGGSPDRHTGGIAGPVAARCAAWSTTARRTTHVGRPLPHPCVQGPAARCRCPRAIPLRFRRWGLLDPVPACRCHVSPDKHRAQRLRPRRRIPGLHQRSLCVLPTSPSPGGPCSGV